jgi:hypothetical protein
MEAHWLRVIGMNVVLATPQGRKKLRVVLSARAPVGYTYGTGDGEAFYMAEARDTQILEHRPWQLGEVRDTQTLEHRVWQRGEARDTQIREHRVYLPPANLQVTQILEHRCYVIQESTGTGAFAAIF